MGFPEDYLVYCEQCGQQGCICDDTAAPRASVMPPHMESVTFLDGVREYAPDEKAIGEKERP